MKNGMLNFGMTACLCLAFTTAGQARSIDDAADLRTQQAQEKQELNEMRQEMQNLRSNMTDALDSMGKVQSQLATQKQKVREFHLQAKEGLCELTPGYSASLLTYNDQAPGPVIKVEEGDPVRIVLHNQLKVPTSLYFHGLTLPQEVSGLPRSGAGLIAPGQSYTYQFIANQTGTFFYHPHTPHLDQMSHGLCGALVVEPRTAHKTYERDFVLIITQANPTGKSGSPLFLVNGKSAPAIAPLDVKRGERIRLRLLNLSQEICPLSLSGHKLEIVANNGSDSLEPHVTRDTLSLNPGDRLDVEFVANNPGVWSFSSLLAGQCSNQGKFPGGIALVVRYPTAK
ncbi:MAG: multicopper oxidase domain-containing protein [Candidatus Obscuribacterales bacterium]|nr:multicopper oxidase domain-containing protein [Candidatus Obscuribacterales bacterium]